jgi:Methylamine utilisation protein MauE
MLEELRTKEIHKSILVRIANTDAIFRLVGAVILIAAWLKWIDVATTPAVSREGARTDSVTTGVIALEVFWSVLLWGGIWPRLLRKASILLFVAFGAVSAYRGIRGDASCGCFGSVRVNPWLTAALDITLCLLLAYARPALREEVVERHRGSILALIGLAFCLGILPIAHLIFRGTATAVSPSGEIADDARFVILDPGQWRGKRFPLVRFLDSGTQFEHGRWRLVFVRRGCSKCRDVLWRLAPEMSGELSVNSARWAVIELPETNIATRGGPTEPIVGVPVARLDDRRSWIADVPFTLTLNDGLVESEVGVSNVRQ